MGRPRTNRNRRLPEGLYRPTHPGGSWRIRNPATGKFASCKATTEERARTIHAAVWPRLLDEKRAAEAAAAETKLTALASSGQTLASFVLEFITSDLPNAMVKKSKRLLSENTRSNYETALRLILSDPSFGALPLRHLSNPELGPQAVRRHLATSINQPAWYNLRRDALTKMFQQAITRGRLTRSPMRDVEKLPTQERNVVIPPEHFVAIWDKLQSMTHEVYARAIDFLYLTAASVDDALSLEDAVNILPNGDLEFVREKTQQPIRMEDNTGDIGELVAWFRDYKQREKIDSPYLIVHPRDPNSHRPEWLSEEAAASMPGVKIAAALGITEAAWRKRVKQHGVRVALEMGRQSKVRRSLIGQRITVAQLRDRWLSATEAAGLREFGYTLRDLRATSLTEEAVIEGEATDKGGHRTESMKRRYVKKRIPMVVQNNLRLVRQLLRDGG